MVYRPTLYRTWIWRLSNYIVLAHIFFYKLMNWVLPYSCKQKHVSISDTPCYQLNSIQLVTWASKNKSCPNELKCEINKMLKISAFYLDKQKSFVPKKICGIILIKTLKSKIYDSLNSNTCFCLQLYGM